MLMPRQEPSRFGYTPDANRDGCDGTATDVPGAITAPRGFLAAAVHCGLKKARNDLAIIASDRSRAAAATFTANLVKAAPVLVSTEQVAAGRATAIVVNSGNANACTGPGGLTDAWAMVRETARVLNIPAAEVLVASTGVIGVPLPLELVLGGIRRAALSLSRLGGRDAARAILTTDTQPKESVSRLEVGGRVVTIGGIAKGSGMIHPNMATMLAFLATDAAIESSLLSRALRGAVGDTFNMITVDGDTSTNDMVAILANGASGAPLIRDGGSDYGRFSSALGSVCESLARKIVLDGEGASRFVEVRVRGAATFEDAKRACMAVARSSLVKTAVFGCDPNWGRMVAAAGNSGAEFSPSLVDVWIGEVKVAQRGAAIPFDEGRARELLSGRSVALTLDLNAGASQARVWTCDLTPDYIRINASYRS